MASNKDLNKLKANPDDEFYTRLSDINAELKHYKHHFKDKVVLCNCDDPRVSNFFHYFAEHFESLGLKKLIATCYKNCEPDLFSTNSSEQAVYIIYEGDKNGNCSVDLDELQVLPLKGDGDFRSAECVELLKEADIVCTNPPFSLIGEYFEQLIRYDKKFLVLGSSAAIHRTEVFPYIRDNKMWTGYKPFSQDMLFEVSKEHEMELRKKKKEGSGWRVVDGVFYGRCPAIWYTNLEIEKKHIDFVSELYKTYTPEEYPTYENFDGIDVSSVRDIPKDYFGNMGVPDSFIDFYNPEQFEILGIGSGDLAKEVGVKKNYRGRSDLAINRNGKLSCPYSRLIIRRK